MTPMEAARRGAGEVGFTVLAMTLSLVAVFIPLLLMGGFVGRFFREFAVVLSAAVGVSLIVSLTTTPMMCSRLLLPAGERHEGRFHRYSERFFSAILKGYGRTLTFALDHAPIMVLVLLTTVALNVFLYVIIPKGFFPQQDTGQLIGRIQADQSISFQAMREKLADFISIVRADPAVATVVGFTGGQQRNTGSMFVTLKPLSGGRDSADKIVSRLRRELAKEPGANLFLTPVQDIRVGGRQSNATYQYTIQADDLAELATWEPRILAALSQLPELVDVNTDQQNKGLSTSLVIDRDAAARLNVTPRLIDATLNDAFAQRQVSTIYSPRNQYKVVMEAAPEYWQSPEALNQMYVSAQDGTQVPLSMFAKYVPTETSLAVNHQSLFVASTISFNLADGISLSQATQAVDAALARIGVPTTVRGSFQGSARAFRASMETQPFLILAALLTLYIVLGVLYESFVHPLTIMSTLPSAGVGALVALMLFNTDFSIIALIGVIMLIGIVQKNAIMMIDFALSAERRGDISARDAIYEACQLRFRPILMTTMSALLAAIPLALGRGDGAELRQPLGIAIGGGLILSQILTLYTTPIVYLYLDRLSDRTRALGRRARRRGREALATRAAD
jgi:multidrug efflux pump